MRSWEGRNAYVCYVCNLETDKQLFEVDFSSIKGNLRFISDSEPWKIYAMDTQGVFLAFYRKRLLLFYSLKNEADFVPTDIIIREFLRSRDEKLLALDNLMVLLRHSITSISRFPILFIDEFHIVRKPRKITQSLIDHITWIDNGATTFFYRIFDSSTRRISYLRLSRHLVVGYGLSDNINYDLVNLIYEKFLYTPRKSEVSPEDVFGLLDGLNRYTVPTELNLFLQDMGLRLAIYLTIMGTLISIAQVVADQIACLYLKTLPYIATVILAFLTWKLLRRLSFVEGE